MKQNQKGFTLIELLAVIVILAIIALIATPIILNVIENARKDSAKDATYGVMDAVKLAYSQDQLKQTPVAPDASGNISTSFTGTAKFGNSDTADPVVVSGKKPESGSVVINTTSGVITANCLKIGNYYCGGSDNTDITCLTTNNTAANNCSN